ncbi:hypothetical protein VP01_3g11 [Puccinia sorghi]|uniref:COP9 signalosome complex subunit 4 n=1 Tax=Puccinia sorghi TaxID=27349 RepID=A0A0L6UTY2_9BASI|nr:hypothetical protein VP01_3g11 [Puccinia sorghi]
MSGRMGIEVAMNRIQQLPQQAKAEAYKEVLAEIFGRPRTEERVVEISEFVGQVVQDGVGLLISKTVLTELVSQINSHLPSHPNDQHTNEFKRDLLQAVINLPQLVQRAVRFEDQISLLREALASSLELLEDWSEAARALQGIPLDGTHRIVSQEYKLNTYIRIVRLLLEDDNATNAESYLNRASLLIPESKDEVSDCEGLGDRSAFKLSQARILDAKRKFEEASKKYHEISFANNLDSEERSSCLSAAVVCGVLASAGPNRTRLLTSLFRDERSSSLKDYKILSKMVLGQIIKGHEMVEFEKQLKPHQLAKLPKIQELSESESESEEGGRTGKQKMGPWTVFDRAVMQHNLLSVSRIYSRISFKGLGKLVGLSSRAVEVMARTMIQERRLMASMDQVHKLITFQDSRDKALDHNDLLVSNVAASAEPNPNPQTGLPASSNSKLQQVAIAPSLFLWDESIM